MPDLRSAELTLRDGTTISFHVAGAGRPLYVLHGGPSTTFEYLVDEVLPLGADHELVFHDYRGSGRSSAAPPDSYTFHQLADDVEELRLHLGHEQISVLAHSMGGFVALTYVLRFPGSCERLILMSSAPTGRPSKLAWRTLLGLDPWRIMRIAGRAIAYVVAWSWKRESLMRRRARYAPLNIMYEGRRECRAIMRERQTRFLAQNDNAPHLERQATSIDLTSRLADVSLPTLVVFGERDAPFAAASRLLRAGLPNATVLALPGVGHEPLVEARDETLTQLDRFLQA